jgi:hypothetical protein
MQHVNPEPILLEQDVWNTVYRKTYHAYAVAGSCGAVKQRLGELLDYLIKIKPLIKPAAPGATYTAYNEL